MAVSYISTTPTNYIVLCLSSDTKPSSIESAILFETDTGTVFKNVSGVWTPRYQEGSFTPTVTLTGAGTAPQYSTTSGTYTKHGRTCFFNILLQGDGGNEGSGAGVITITLPFSTSADQLPITIQGGVSNNGGTENILFIKLTPSSSTMTIKRQQSATSLVDFTGADQNNTTRTIQLMGKILI